MKYNVTIDRLRGFSVIVVICMHTLFFFPNVLTFLGKALWNGYYGVTAFFCTSGFLITTNLLKRYGCVAKVDNYAFYVMRFARIVPSLGLLLVALSLLSLTTFPSFHFPATISLKETLLKTLTFRYNVFYKHGGSYMLVWSILWSLSIEEVFYLAYPLIAKLTRSALCLALILVFFVVYAPFHRHGDISRIYDYFGCFDGIALGSLSALAARRFSKHLPNYVSWTMMSAGAALVVYTYTATNITIHFNPGLTLIALGASLVLFASQCGPFAKERSWPYDPLAYVGRLSYEMYLFHMTIFALLSGVVMPRFKQEPVLIFAIGIFCVVAISDVISRFYAEPFNRWIRFRLLPSSEPQQTTVTTVREPAR